MYVCRLYTGTQKLINWIWWKSQRLFLKMSEKFREYVGSLNHVKQCTNSAKSNPWLLVAHLGRIISQSDKELIGT